jgi:hypothetical protein
MIRKAASPPLTPVQVGWLCAMLLSAQWPLWGHILNWNAVAGATLVVARVALPPKWRELTRHRRWLCWRWRERSAFAPSSATFLRAIPASSFSICSWASSSSNRAARATARCSSVSRSFFR